MALALATVIAVAFQDTLKIDLGSSSGVTKVTSGRSDLIGGGLELFANRPLQGYGSGSFGRAYRQERKGNQQQAVSASHTMPVTVAAEQGLIGLAAYLAVVAAALLVLFGDRAVAQRCLRCRWRRAALAAMFVALLVHTMVYAAFLEDPFTWVILAAGAALAPLAKLRDEARARARAAARIGARDDLMTDFLRRLASTGAAYTASSVIAKLFAVALLPLYTRHLTRADYGAAEVLLAAVVALSIFFRLGIIEALLRFYYEREDERAL